MVFKTVLTQTVVLEMKNTLSWSKLHTVIIWNTFCHFFLAPSGAQGVTFSVRFKLV